MGLAGILSLGYKILKIDDFLDISYHIYTGAIVGFKFKGKQYRYYDHEDFLKTDYKKLVKDDIRFTEGYYEEDKFLEYLAAAYDYATLTLNNKFSLNSLSTPVVGKDKVQLVRVKTSEPYVAPLKFQRITWDYTDKSVYDQNSVNLIIPESALVKEEIYPLDEVASSYYTNNIGLIANSSYISQDQRAVAVGVLSSITLTIDQIVKETFSILNKNNEFTEFIASQTYHWKQELKHVNVTLQQLKEYERTLVSFYTAIYRSQLFLKSENDEIKWLLLASILSDSSIKIVPLKNRIQILEIIGRDDIPGEVLKEFGVIDREKIVINILKNINSGEEDVFLVALAGPCVLLPGTFKSLLEVLSLHIDNSGFMVGLDNLDRLMSEMYNIWFHSSYNPNDQLSDNDLKEKDDNKPISINYTLGTSAFVFTSTNYNFKYIQDQIEVIPIDDTATHQKENLHMFRCIMMMATNRLNGNQQIMQLNINGEQQFALPLFYLKYIDDKKRTENVIKGIEIGVDLTLTLMPLANLAKLRHIFRLTNFGRALLGRAVLSQPELVLMRIEFARGALAAVDITAGFMSIYYGYAQEIQDVCIKDSGKYDQEKCDNYNLLSNLLMFACITGGVLDVVASAKVERAAQKILDSSLGTVLHPEIIAVLSKLASSVGDSARVLRTFSDKVNDAVNKPNVTQAFLDWWNDASSLTMEIRLRFIQEYGDDLGKLVKFRRPEMLTNWHELAIRNISLSREVRFLEHTDEVNRLLEVVDNPNLKKVFDAILETNTTSDSITAFLKTFDDIGAAYYTKFADDVTLVKSWFRYYDEPKLSSIFLQLKKDGTLKFVERYGKCSDEGFNMIKSNAKVHIDRLLEYPDATHHVDYFNNRRAEMLPPSFEDKAKKDFYGIQEIDSFIELELILETKMRASLEHEAGDIIADVGNLKGASFDPMGVPHNIGELFQSGKQSYSKWLGRLGNDQVKGKGFLGSIQTHIEKIDFPSQGKPKLDRVIIDYKYFDDISIEIGQNQDYFKNYIDNILFENFQQYKDKIIKLNY